MRILSKSLPAFINHALLLITAFLFSIPLVWALKSGFTPTGEIFTTELLHLPSKLSLDNIRSGLTYAPFDSYFLNSLSVAIFVTLGILLTSTLAGYAFSKFEFSGKSILFVVVIAGMLLPFQAILIPLFIEIRYLHLIDSLKGVAIPGAISGFGIFMMRQFMMSIPNELIEASLLDGCTQLQVFRRLIIPISKGPISALGALAFLASWNNFLWPLVVIQDESRMTIPLGLALFRGNNATAYGEVFAVSLFAAIPVAIIFIFMRRQIVESFSTSGIK
jgi:ABC-type glycerol-3-phosphate transport system permease component